MSGLGGNLVNEELKRRAASAGTLLDEIAERQEDLKALYAAAKSDGYDMKAFRQIIKELRRGPEFQSAQLELELVLDTYRRGVGLPVTLEAAQEALGNEARAVPEPKSSKRSRAKETVQ